MFTNWFSVVDPEIMQYTMLSGSLDTSMRILSPLLWTSKEHIFCLPFWLFLVQNDGVVSMELTRFWTV